jgi:hypothetical protein
MINTKVDVLVISLGSPLLVGIYYDKRLIKSYIKKEKTSDVLPMIFDEILKEFQIGNLFFAKGPGSFMAIKITYIFLRTLSITLDIPIFATDGFSFNKNSPIKAVGNRFFMKKDDNITVEILKDSSKVKFFELPDILNKTIFSADVEPLYVLPAV